MHSQLSCLTFRGVAYASAPLISCRQSVEPRQCRARVLRPSRLRPDSSRTCRSTQGTTHCCTNPAPTWRRTLQCSAVGSVGAEQPDTAHVSWQRIVVFIGGAMLLASLHRVAFSVLAVPFKEEFSLTAVQVGQLQSAILMGYVFGQVPAGIMADKIGGPQIMLAGLVLWCCCTGLMPLVRAAPAAQQLLVLMLLRASLGLSQAVALPSTSAAVSRWVPENFRGRALTGIHAFYNAGNVTALSCTPLLISRFGWPWCLRIYSAMGLLWAVAFASSARAQLPPQPPQQQAAEKAQVQPERQQGRASQVVMLCIVHIIISWGFFIFQAWMPTYLRATGMTDLQEIGALSAIPWMGAAAVGVLAGIAADWLHTAREWPLVQVRRRMQLVASLGPAVSLLPLAVKGASVRPSTAVACLTAAVALQAFCYSGFHAYVQDVAPRDAGKLLGLTNSCGTAAGVVANLLTGRLAAAPGGYSWVFSSCIALYLVCAVCWIAFARGQTVSLPSRDS